MESLTPYSGDQDIERFSVSSTQSCFGYIQLILPKLLHINSGISPGLTDSKIFKLKEKIN